MAEVGKFTDLEQDEPEPRHGVDTTPTARIGYSTPRRAVVNHHGLEDVEFWDYKRCSDLPKVPVRLLERAGFIWDLASSDVDEPFAEWNILGQAEENDNWMRPGTSDPVDCHLG